MELSPRRALNLRVRRGGGTRHCLLSIIVIIIRTAATLSALNETRLLFIAPSLTQLLYDSTRPYIGYYAKYNLAA
jgi:hypothetical protein